MQDRDQRISPATAALGGLLIGLATGIIATAMSNKQTRKKILTKADQMGQAVEETYGRATTKVNDTWESEIQPRIHHAEDVIRKTKHNGATKARQEAEELAVKGGEVMYEAADDQHDKSSGRKSRS